MDEFSAKTVFRVGDMVTIRSSATGYSWTPATNDELRGLWKIKAIFDDRSAGRLALCRKCDPFGQEMEEWKELEVPIGCLDKEEKLMANKDKIRTESFSGMCDRKSGRFARTSPADMRRAGSEAARKLKDEPLKSAIKELLRRGLTVSIGYKKNMAEWYSEARISFSDGVCSVHGESRHIDIRKFASLDEGVDCFVRDCVSPRNFGYVLSRMMQKGLVSGEEIDAHWSRKVGRFAEPEFRKEFYRLVKEEKKLMRREAEEES